MKTTGPTSASIAPEYRVARAAIVGIACGFACALLTCAAEAFGGPSAFSSKVLPMALCCLAPVVFLDRTGPRRRNTTKPRPLLDDRLA